MDVAGKSAVAVREAVSDLVELVARAVLGGVGVAVLMAVAILALSGGAEAATVKLDDAKSGTLLLRTEEAGIYNTAPQVSTEIGIRVSGMVARTKVTQLFHNPAAEHVEGLYVFPLPEKAAVDRMRMRVGERVLEGQVQEKGEARKTYETAKAEGRKATLMEQHRPNLFTNAVAHIGPGETVEITIEYQQALQLEGGEYRLRFPMAVAPRYQPADALEGVPSSPRGLVNPVDIAVSIDAGMPVADVRASYHETTVQKKGNGALVTLAREQESMDRDFELAWSVAGATAQAALFVERRNGAEYALLMVVPPSPDAAEQRAAQRTPRETILIVDTSGSMAGTSMEQAKAAVEQALDGLTARDRFNVVEFNSTMTTLFPASMQATLGNVTQARAWVRALKAGGGTEMRPALDFALSSPEAAGYLRQVVFMTDGGVSNEDELFRLIAQKLGTARLFTVGIGSAPNGHFMTKAAQFGRGTFTHIGDVNEVHEKMARLFQKIEAPVLRDVAIRWPDGSAVETFPARVPDLYLGEPIVVSAASARPFATVIVSGLRGNQPWSVALTPGGAEAAGVGALWARAKIASLMDEVTRGGDVEKLRPAIVQVALEHHLVSAYTSLVAVDVTPTAPGVSKVALVKTAAPRGSDGKLPQTDTPATLQFLIGLASLLAAAMLAVTGRRAA